ncbi:MAG: hypothetical protein WKF28_08290 [Rubrobacteraceae bacterium]
MDHAGGVLDSGRRHVSAVTMTFIFFLALAAPAVAQQDEAGENTQAQSQSAEPEARQAGAQDAMRATAGDKNGASASSNDGCAVAQAGDVVVEAGCDDENGGNGGSGNSGPGNDNNNGNNDGDGDGGNVNDGGQQPDAGPLEGEPVTVEFGGDEIPDSATINVAGCKVDTMEGSEVSITVKDKDGKRGTVTDGDGVEITATEKQVVVTRIAGAATFPGFESLQPPVIVVSSTRITCDGDTGGGPGEDPGAAPAEDGDLGSENNPLPADDEVGPLEGAEAIGRDIDVQGDIIGTDPETGEKVVGIDTITIQTTNCEVTTPDDLSVTLSIIDGGPGRFIDGARGDRLDNAEITVDQNEVTIRGQGPGNVVEPFFVEQGAQPGDIFVQSAFKVISSTGVGGNGCQAVKAANDSNEGDDGGNGGDVIDGTVPDQNLPDTGGSVVLVAVAALLGVSGLLGFAIARRRP